MSAVFRLLSVLVLGLVWQAQASDQASLLCDGSIRQALMDEALKKKISHLEILDAVFTESKPGVYAVPALGDVDGNLLSLHYEVAVAKSPDSCKVTKVKELSRKPHA